MDELFTVEVHHLGHFVEDPVRYVDGVVNHVDEIDPEKWSKLEVEEIIERLGYPKYKLLWYRIPWLGLEEGLRVIATDEDAMDMTKVVKGYGQIEVYVEHIAEEEDELGKSLVPLPPQKIVEGVESHYYSHTDGSVSDVDYPISDDLFGSDIEMDDGTNNEESLRSDYESEELVSAEDSLESENEIKTMRLSKFETFKPPHRAENLRFEKGMLFSSLRQFKTAITEYAVHGGYGIKFQKNDRTRVRAVCEDGCTWKALCSKVPRQETYQIKTLEMQHECNRSYKNVRLSSKFLAGKLVNKVRDQPNLRLSTIQEKVNKKFVLQISRSTAYRAKRRALDMVEGSHKEQYASLWDYCNELRRSNPGSTIKMNVVGFDVGDEQAERGQKNPTFKRLYICFDACKRGFAACRPVIGIDGCHLKGPYGGVLLTAVGRDPNEQYFPLAFAVVEAENKDSWRWFITLLLEDVGTQRTYTFTSDQQKGLDATLKELQPGGEHRFCCRHLYNNLRKKYPGVLIKEFFWKAAYSGYREMFKRAMNELMKANINAHNWVQEVPVEVWSRHAFSGNAKTDTLLNNSCEAFNSTILEAREKPIISMVEDIRIYLMQRFQKNRTLIQKVEGVLCPVIQKRLNKEKEVSGRWTALWSGASKFEVKGFYDTFTIDLERGECSCRKWLLTGIPCSHAIACIHFNKQKAEDYTSDYYKVHTYMRVYAPMIGPTNGANLWEGTGYPPVMPPIVRRPAGRPKKLRRREQDEPNKGTKLKRSGSTVVCQRCNKTGHNRRTCKGLVGGNKDLPGESSSQATRRQGCGVDKSIGEKGGQKQVQNAGLKSAPSQAVEGAPNNASKAKKGAPSKAKKGAASKAKKGGPSKAPKAPQVATDKALTLGSSNGPPPKKGLKRSRVSNVLLKDIYDFS